VCSILTEFDIPVKLTGLSKVFSNEPSRKFRKGENLSDVLPIETGLK
jgi:hypothetical protein